MDEKIKQEKIPAWKRQAWLVEYEVCQKLINQQQSHYWTIFSIFIGISTAVIGWIASSMTNETSFTVNGNLFTLGQAISLNKQMIITVLGCSFIFIIWVFKLWLKRIDYTEKLNYLRMREIEIKLDMWQGWRIHTLDKWSEFKKKFKREKDNLIEKISSDYWVIFRNRLQEGLSNSEYCANLDDKKDKIIEIIRSSKEQGCFEGSFRKLHYPLLTNTLISLWLFLILYVWSICWLQLFALILFGLTFLFTIVITILLRKHPDWRENCKYFRCLDKFAII